MIRTRHIGIVPKRVAWIERIILLNVMNIMKKGTTQAATFTLRVRVGWRYARMAVVVVDIFGSVWYDVERTWYAFTRDGCVQECLA